MKYLLDTHTFVWASAIPKKLSAKATAEITDPSNTLVISAATPFEMSIKERLGKFPEATYLLAHLDESIAALNAVSLPMTNAHGVLAGSLDWSHRDLFDRLLAAQAMLENAVLITKDPQFSNLPALRTLW